jgi:hypothetical protein
MRHELYLLSPSVLRIGIDAAATHDGVDNSRLKAQGME